MKKRDKPRSDRLRRHIDIYFISTFVTSTIAIRMANEAHAIPRFTSYSYYAFCAVRKMLPFSVWYAGHRKRRRKIPRLCHAKVRISEKPSLVSECDRGVQFTSAS